MTDDITLLETADILCPYCGEQFTTSIDTSVPEQSYIEDCEVCCSPILLDVIVDMDGEHFQVNARQENE